MIAQKNVESQDLFALSRSSEYLGQMLKGSIRSELFINEMIATGKVDEEFLPFDKKKRLKEWNKMVQADYNYQTGIFSVNVFNDDQRETMAVAQGIVEVLKSKSGQFLGNNPNVDVIVLSGPILEKNPSLEKIVILTVWGFIFGALLMIIKVYYWPERKSVYLRESDEYLNSLNNFVGK